MRLIIAGSRSFPTSLYSWADAMLIGMPMISEIVSGTASGADTYGEDWAHRHKVSVRRFPANWLKHGKGAGFRRNEEMAIYADAAVIFWDGISRGSKNMIDQAIKHRCDTHVFFFTLPTGDSI